MSFSSLWSELEPIGRDPGTGGYRRYAWTGVDETLREWFTAQAQARGLDVVTDRAGNQWAWLGNPDQTPGIVVGSHLDSVPDGGAFDGPLGVVSAFAALDELRARGVEPRRPLGIVNFADEEGARFGIACAGSRIITGALDPATALALRDVDGTRLGEVIGANPAHLGRDEQTLRRVAAFVELHVEQGRALEPLGAPVGVGSGIWPHGRWRVELAGQANHAGTTALADRHDPMLALADVIIATRSAARGHEAVATCGKVTVAPNAVNAIPSAVTAWLDARGADEARVLATIDDVRVVVSGNGGTLTRESWTPTTSFDPRLVARLATVVGGGSGTAPVLATGAGHDAGILANAGIPAAMLFVRNPTGVSHSPAEHAETADCLAGIAALADAIEAVL